MKKYIITVDEQKKDIMGNMPLVEKAKELIMAYGTKRVLFGTDYPMWEPKEELDRFMKIDLTDKERKDILYNNAAKMFNIK